MEIKLPAFLREGLCLAQHLHMSFLMDGAPILDHDLPPVIPPRYIVTCGPEQTPNKNGVIAGLSCEFTHYRFQFGLHKADGDPDIPSKWRLAYLRWEEKGPGTGSGASGEPLRHFVARHHLDKFMATDVLDVTEATEARLKDHVTMPNLPCHDYTNK